MGLHSSILWGLGQTLVLVDELFGHYSVCSEASIAACSSLRLPAPLVPFQPISHYSFASQWGGILLPGGTKGGVKRLLALPEPEHQSVETHLSSDQRAWGAYPPYRRIILSTPWRSFGAGLRGFLCGVVGGFQVPC